MMPMMPKMSVKPLATRKSSKPSCTPFSTWMRKKIAEWDMGAVSCQPSAISFRRRAKGRLHSGPCVLRRAHDEEDREWHRLMPRKNILVPNPSTDAPPPCNDWLTADG